MVRSAQTPRPRGTIPCVPSIRERMTVKHVIQLHIEKLPEGVYLATSDEVQGLVARGRTIQETLEIARDVAKKLIRVQARYLCRRHAERLVGR